jgi:hypothetical protein
MDRAPLEAALAYAEIRVATCDQLIARQRKIIADLELVTADVTSERLVLAQLETEQRDRIERRDILREELNFDWS